MSDYEECSICGELFEPISNCGCASKREPLVDHAKRDEFKALCDPLIKWLNDNFHPHVSVIVTPTSAELSSGETAYTTEAYLRD